MGDLHKIRWRQIKRVVIKIGSNVISDDKGPRKTFFNRLKNEIAPLLAAGIKPVLVTSGAVATGMALTGLSRKPASIPARQALAAIGQPHLMQLYAKAFSSLPATVAQILLTQPGLENRQHFLNARHALEELIEQKVIPIINENDTVAVDEIKVGDNDQLSAHVAHLVNADLLIILSDVDGLYDSDPRQNPDAQLIPEVMRVDKNIAKLAGGEGTTRSTGGMHTKLKAARIGNDFGIPVVITNGFHKNFLTDLRNGSARATIFWPSPESQSSRKIWIANVLKPKGKLIIDDGAAKALAAQGRSLLPIGLKDVMGKFEPGDCVEIMTAAQTVIAKGLTAYSAEECLKIKGCKTAEIEKILGYRSADEIIHRDDMTVIKDAAEN